MVRVGYEMTEDQGNITMDTEFSFDRLSDDRKFAIFRGERVPGDFQKLQRECLREAMEGDNIEKPAHCVQIRRQVYDTEIPGIQLDLQALELTCDWRGMYSAFFAEEKRCNKMTNTWVWSAPSDTLCRDCANTKLVNRSENKSLGLMKCVPKRRVVWTRVTTCYKR